MRQHLAYLLLLQGWKEVPRAGLLEFGAGRELGEEVLYDPERFRWEEKL